MNDSGPIIENSFGWASAPAEVKPKKPILTFALIAVAIVELIVIIVLAASLATKTSTGSATAPEESGIGDNVEQKNMAVDDFSVPLGFYAAATLGLDQNRQTLDVAELNQIVANYVGYYGGTALNIADPREITTLAAESIQSDIYPHSMMRKLKIGTARACAELVFYSDFTMLASYKLENGSCYGTK